MFQLFFQITLNFYHLSFFLNKNFKVRIKYDNFLMYRIKFFLFIFNFTIQLDAIKLQFRQLSNLIYCFMFDFFILLFQLKILKQQLFNSTNFFLQIFRVCLFKIFIVNS